MRESRIYIIDTEKLRDFSRIFKYENITENDEIYYFRTKGSGKDITLRDKCNIEKTGVKFEYREVINRGSAIDFDIIGFICGKMDRLDDITVVTSSKNYPHISGILEDEIGHTFRIIKLDDYVREDYAHNDTILSVIEEVGIEHKDKILDILVDAKTLKILHLELYKAFGSKGVEIFKAVEEEYMSVMKDLRREELIHTNEEDISKIITNSVSMSTLIDNLFNHFRGDSVYIMKGMEKEMINKIEGWYREECSQTV